MVIQLEFHLVCSVALRKKSGELFFHIFNKIQDGRRITCYSEELELLHRFVPRKQLTGLHKNLMTALYFSIIKVLCGVGGDASFAPQANLVCTVDSHLPVRSPMRSNHHCGRVFSARIRSQSKPYQTRSPMQSDHQF